MTDQYTFKNPVTAYEHIEPPKQHQPEPGLDAKLTPKADLGEDTYRGTGRLEGARRLSPARIRGSAPPRRSPLHGRVPTSCFPTCPRKKKTRRGSRT